MTETLLVAVGRKPLTANIGLEGTKVELDRGFIKVNEYQQTGEPGVYAIGDVVAGTYRFKKDEEEYMGQPALMPDGQVAGRKDGCLKAVTIPAGFLKVTRQTINQFMAAYPDLVYGEPCNPSVDLFNHGAHKGIWYGEDYAFSRNWNDAGGEIWILPDIDLDHHSKDQVFKGNYHKFLSRAA